MQILLRIVIQIVMGEAMLRDERGCTAQSRRAYHYWTQTLACATALQQLKGHEEGPGDGQVRMGEFRQLSYLPTWGQPLEEGGDHGNIVPKIILLDPKNSFW